MLDHRRERAKLRFGAIVLAYNQEEYISYCLRALAPHVAHVVVVFSELPWTAYNPRAREMLALADGTGAHLAALQRELSNLTVIEGVWSREEAMRNAGLDVIRTLGVDVCLVLEADEFYPEGGLRQLELENERHNVPRTRYYVPYLACFKRVDRLLETQQNGPTTPVMRAAAAVHLDHDTRFYRWRHTTGTPIDLPTTFFFWNMGYVLSDDRMWEKVNSWGHAAEVLPGWFEEKWLQWTPQTRDLFYRNPASRWPRTTRFDPVMLPEILHGHPRLRLKGAA